MKLRQILSEDNTFLPHGLKISVKKQGGQYVAIDFNSYDGAADSNTKIYGKGSTKMRAVAHLVDQLKDIKKYDERILRRAEEKYYNSTEYKNLKEGKKGFDWKVITSHGPEFKVEKRGSMYYATDKKTYNDKPYHDMNFRGTGRSEKWAINTLADHLVKYEVYDEKLVRKAEKYYLTYLERKDKK